MQNTQALETDSSHEVDANGIVNEIDDLVGFLRRFASMMTGGDNADNLHGAANLIEDLVDALDRGRKELRDVEARLDQSVRAHAVAQVEVASTKAELGVLQTELAEQKRKADVAREAIFNEAQAQSLRGDRAERQLRDATTELENLRTRLTDIGESFVILPVAVMDSLRAQFTHLGREFARTGDAASQAMCEIGACTVVDAVAEGRKQLPEKS